jgi:hypothetical protein
MRQLKWGMRDGVEPSGLAARTGPRSAAAGGWWGSSCWAAAAGRSGSRARLLPRPARRSSPSACLIRRDSRGPGLCRRPGLPPAGPTGRPGWLLALLPRLFARRCWGLFILLVILGPGGPARTVRARWRRLGSLPLRQRGAPGPLTWGQADRPRPRARARRQGRLRLALLRPRPRRLALCPVDQINRENVDKLVAWTFRTGEKLQPRQQDQNTLPQVGDTVYVCTPTNVVIAWAPHRHGKWLPRPEGEAVLLEPLRRRLLGRADRRSRRAAPAAAPGAAPAAAKPPPKPALARP